MRPLSLLVLSLSVACARSTNGRNTSASTTSDSVQATVPSIDSVLAILDAYAAKRVSATAAAKIVVDYLVGTNQPLNVQMDAELRDAVSRELKARGR